jgi:hypothetical protein
MRKLKRALQLLHAERFRFVVFSSGLSGGSAPPVNAVGNIGN